MKKIVSSISAIALAGVMAISAFSPYVSALDLVPPAEMSEESSTQSTKAFSVDSSTLEFGRINELDRSYTKVIEVKNNTDAEIAIDVKVEKYADADDKNAQMADWIAFVGGATHFTIAKDGGTTNVKVRVMVPKTVDAGTQYANVVIDGAGMSEVVRVKADIAGDGFKYDSEAFDDRVDPVHIDDKLGAHASVKNTGTAGFTSTYQIKTKNVLSGAELSVLTEESKEVAPGKEVSFGNTSVLGYGIYYVEQRVTFVNKDGIKNEKLISRTVINLPWWALVIAGGVILLIIVLIIVIKHKKKSKKRKAQAEMKKVERKAKADEVDRIERAEEEAIAAEEELAEEPVEEKPAPVARKRRVPVEEEEPVKIKVRKIQ